MIFKRSIYLSLSSRHMVFCYNYFLSRVGLDPNTNMVPLKHAWCRRQSKYLCDPSSIMASVFAERLQAPAHVRDPLQRLENCWHDIVNSIHYSVHINTDTFQSFRPHISQKCWSILFYCYVIIFEIKMFKHYLKPSS